MENNQRNECEVLDTESEMEVLEIVPVGTKEDSLLDQGASGVSKDTTVGDTQARVKRSVKCLKCGKELSSASNLKRHVEIYHSNNHQCQICDKFFQTSQLLMKHSQQHSAFDCKICGKTYSSSDSLRVHRNRKHNDNKENDSNLPYTFECDDCGKKYSCKDTLRAHIKKSHKN